MNQSEIAPATQDSADRKLFQKLQSGPTHIFEEFRRRLIEWNENDTMTGLLPSQQFSQERKGDIIWEAMVQENPAFAQVA